MRKTDTATLVKAMRIIARFIHCDDDIAMAALAEVADRLDELDTAMRRIADHGALLTPEERYAIEAGARLADRYDTEMDGFPSGVGDTLRKMAIRIGGEW